MGWLSGILSGYADRQGEIRKEAAARDEKAAATEAAVYNSLLNSEDPKLQEYGATGILQLGQGRKRKGGFSGWMGEMESSPIYPVVQKYLTTPQTIETVTPGLPATRLPQTATALPTLPAGHQPAPLALPDASPTEGEAMATPQPPPSPSAVATPPPPPPSSVLPPMRMAASHAPTGVGPSPPPAPPHLASAPPGSPASVLPPMLLDRTREPAPAAAAAAAATPDAATPTPGTEAPPPLSSTPAPGSPLPSAAPPASALTERVPGPTVGRTDVHTYQPRLPSAADAVAAGERAKVRGEIAGLQEVYKQQGDPDWQKKGVDAYLQQHGRAGAFRPINVERTRPDGTVEQDLALLNASTGQVFMQDGVTPLPAEYRPVIKAAGAGRALNKREEIASALFGTGKPGEDPITLAKSLQPWQHAKVLREEGILAAEAALRRAESLADAPLSAQARAALTTTLAADWRAAQKPLLAMQQDITKMNVGVRDYDQNPNAASQAVISTFNHILDPTSVVRESEYSRTPEGLGLIHRVQGMYEKLLAGGAGVPKADLIGMAETARQFLAELADFNAGERARLEFRAQQNNIDSRGIFGNSVAVPPPVGMPPVTPPPGALTAPPVPPPASGSGTSSNRASIGKNEKGQKTITIP